MATLEGKSRRAGSCIRLQSEKKKDLVGCMLPRCQEIGQSNKAKRRCHKLRNDATEWPSAKLFRERKPRKSARKPPNPPIIGATPEDGPEKRTWQPNERLQRMKITCRPLSMVDEYLAIWAALMWALSHPALLSSRNNFGGFARGYGGGYKRRQDDRDRDDRDERERNAPASRPGRR